MCPFTITRTATTTVSLTLTDINAHCHHYHHCSFCNTSPCATMSFSIYVVLISIVIYKQYTAHEVVLKLIEEINPSKAAGIDKIGGRFLKDGATALASPIKEWM